MERRGAWRSPLLIDRVTQQRFAGILVRNPYCWPKSVFDAVEANYHPGPKFPGSEISYTLYLPNGSPAISGAPQAVVAERRK
jgi:hypothetical protein